MKYMIVKQVDGKNVVTREPTQQDMEKHVKAMFEFVKHHRLIAVIPLPEEEL